MSNLQSKNPFDSRIGSSRLENPVNLLIILGIVLLAALIVIKFEILGLAGCIGIMGAGVFSYLLFQSPQIGLYTAVILGFLLLGIGRYAKDLQVGLGMDAILIFTYIALLFNRFKERMNWTPAKRDITLLSFVWFMYSIFQIINPEARSFAAWFSGRSVGIYMFLIVPLTLLFIDNTKKIYIFLYIWGALSILATLKGIMQVKVGVDFAEQAWLNEGNAKTHILFGKLRAFSFLSDAGQFGANQGYSAVVALIAGMATDGKLKKFFFYSVAILALYGLVISGTRGALSVPFAGFGLFVLLRKNIVAMSIGGFFLVALIVFFKFTTIGQGNADIRRMRTAFDPNDASLQVRLNNQKLLKNYMASRPFGGGIGHGGVKAQRFLPNAYLSQIPTDSWYVLIWVEQGIVGLAMHLFILFYILIKASYRIMFKVKDEKLKLLLSALASGMFGIMVASYGNAVLGQMPTNVLIYMSMAILLNSDVLDNETKLSNVGLNPPE
ncbi:MAG: O-antigen ligase family protein [Bacteroidia bacterium]|nr:O-antigen ligase family protein [Bacteroidia bacterium]